MKYPELNEGIYVNDQTTYDNAMENLYDWWMESGNITAGTRVFEIGFGYGMLGKNTIDRGGYWTGINNNQRQVDYARNVLGLVNATRGDWRNIPEEYVGKFDVIFVKGCIEHFVDHSEALNGESRDKYEGLMKNLTNLIDPKSTNKRFVMSMMRHRTPVDSNIFKKRFYEHPRYSDNYHLAIINNIWGGHYPNSLNEVIGRIEDMGMKAIDYVDDTKDYYLTTVDWNRITKESLFKINNFSDTPVVNARWVLRGNEFVDPSQDITETVLAM